MGIRAHVAAAVAASGGLVLAIAPAAAAKCNPGVHTHGGVESRTFCGHASAHVTLAGKTLTIKGGECLKTSNYFTINIGTIVLSGNPPNKPDYFGITVGKVPGGGGKPAGKDGTYTGGAVAFVAQHKSYAVRDPAVVLAGNRSKGSFSGSLFTGGQVSGVFSCS
jgi:hypothetical protein